MAIFLQANGNQYRCRPHTLLRPDLGVDRVKPDIGIPSVQIPVPPKLNFRVDLLRASAYQTAVYVGKAQINKQLIHPAGRDTGNIGLADDADQGPVHPLILLQDRGIEAAVP